MEQFFCHNCLTTRMGNDCIICGFIPKENIFGKNLPHKDENTWYSTISQSAAIQASHVADVRPHKDNTNLKYCVTCIQMTNHNETTCLKCGLAHKDKVEWVEDYKKIFFEQPKGNVYSNTQLNKHIDFIKTLLAHREESLRRKIEAIGEFIANYSVDLCANSQEFKNEILALMSDK